MHGYDGAGWMMGGMGWWWILVLVLLVVLMIALVRQARDGGLARRGESAEEILRQRFARGEIQRQEYEEKLAVLRGGR